MKTAKRSVVYGSLGGEESVGSDRIRNIIIGTMCSSFAGGPRLPIGRLMLLCHHHSFVCE